MKSLIISKFINLRARFQLQVLFPEQKPDADRAYVPQSEVPAVYFHRQRVLHPKGRRKNAQRE